MYHNVHYTVFLSLSIFRLFSQTQYHQTITIMGMMLSLADLSHRPALSLYIHFFEPNCYMCCYPKNKYENISTCFSCCLFSSLLHI